MGKAKRAALYVRVSTDHQSVENQVRELCELEGTSRSTIRASADGGGSKEVMWPSTYKLQCSLCALNAGNYRISLPKTLRSCWRHYPRLWRALFSLPTVLPPAIRLAERKA